ncbi:GGDEF domain-containing protein [Methylocystis parvus]|uniref:diguanylate cyclase n=1 Tax=Methylocystis parvus TaxID=134 RepID=A0A6B8LZX2_9HYPH|nr:GGDEF domain-containing protein [Methylocystis parvus]QGM96101.1 GGDEF domain-containing protein [Methylocystis parvus]WBK00076.1 GGDEF domain-containing protein [Methylocystis parvus OBBP]
MSARHFLQPRNKREAVRLVVIYTTIAIVVAVGITWITNWMTGAPTGLSLIRAVVIPLLLAPWMVWTVANFALQLHEMHGELEKLVRVDPLSGALNRRGLAEFAEKAFAENRKTGRFSVIVLDVDRFKSINDNYGHAAGDLVIARVADITRQMLGCDRCAVGRLGGDELVALLVGKNLEETMSLAEKMRDAIENTILIYDDVCVKITTSIGVSAVSARDRNAEAVLKRADQSLYAAKTAGRNRVRAAA